MLSFMPSADVLAAYTLACIILFITPGPDMSLFLARTVTGGRKLGIASMLGANLGCLVHTLLAAIGVSALLAASEMAFTVLKIVGALYLGWLAIDAIRNGSALNVRTEGETKEASMLGTFWTGLAVNLANPKVVLFFVTFLPQFVQASDPFAREKLAFLGSYFVLTNIPLSIVMILGAERLIDWLKDRPKVLRGIDYSFAGIFGLFALKILTTQSLK
jgi:threonine/homoserine/homoserine lactone efflux protein